MNPSASFEIIVVDNASQDGSPQHIAQQFPKVRLIRNTKNIGFASACNQGFKASVGGYCLIMNSDTEMRSEQPLFILEELFRDNLKIGVVGAQLFFPNGRLQSSGRRFLTSAELVKTQLLFSTRIQIFRPKKSGSVNVHVDYVDGAFLALRRHTIEEIGLFDEQFFMYAEDMDLCMRAKKAGWKVAVTKDIRVLHCHAASARQNFCKILLHNAKNVSRFNSRYYGTNHGRFAYDVILLGMLLRIPLSMIRRNGLAGDYWAAFIKGLHCRKTFLGT